MKNLNNLKILHDNYIRSKAAFDKIKYYKGATQENAVLFNRFTNDTRKLAEELNYVSEIIFKDLNFTR